MIERLTYVCSIAVAIVAWAVGLLVADLTGTPVLYASKTTRPVDILASAGAARSSDETTCIDSARSVGQTAPSTGLGTGDRRPVGTRTIFEFSNLSRKGRIKDLTITMTSTPGCALQLRIEGSEWTRDNVLAHCSATVTSLMPGNRLTLAVDHANACSIGYRLKFADTEAVRTIGPGIESFLLVNWLRLIAGLLIAAVVVFVFALVKAYRLSKAAYWRPPEPPPESEIMADGESGVRR